MNHTIVPVVTAERLHDFSVGLLDDNPTSTTPVAGEYPLCATHAGSVSAGAKVEMTCSILAKGRYVIVQIPGSSEILTLCEVQVYGYSEYS